MKSIDQISRIITLGLYAAACLFWLGGWTINAIESRIEDNAAALVRQNEREAIELRERADRELAQRHGW